MTTIETKRARSTLARGALSLARARRLDQPQGWPKLGKKKGLIPQDSVPSCTTDHNGELTKSTLLPSRRVLNGSDVADWALVAPRAENGDGF